MSHSAAGPSRSTTAQPAMPSAIPNRKRTRSAGARAAPAPPSESPNPSVARRSITLSPIRLVSTLETTRPLTYSTVVMGAENTLRKFRDQTSSKNAMATPCITRPKKSQSRIAPSSTGTKSKRAAETEFR